jgi:protein SCO1/2
MRIWLPTLTVLSCSFLFLPVAKAADLPSSSSANSPAPRAFAAKGVVEELPPGAKTIVIRHEAIAGYMDAMTMSFTAQNPAELATLQRGDEITFQLHVSATESWVDHLIKTGTATPVENKKAAATGGTPSVQSGNLLLDYKFTNELGLAVSLNDFRGQALAITFFYTRCPIPEYCPRLSKNFQEASQKLKALPGAPANWHLLSVSFDTEIDSPAMLKAYGDSYGYDPAHWSFLTGPAEKIGELAEASGASYRLTDGAFDHNFRTLIVDATGHLQMIFPTGGNLSDQIVSEIIKAAAVTNPAPTQNP